MSNEKMKALIITEKGIDIADKDIPVPNKDEVLIKMSAAALNHRDQWIREGLYPRIQPGTTLGSDGCGEVVAVGDETLSGWKGKTVVVNPNNDWGDNPAVQQMKYSILGMPSDGTMAEYMVTKADRLAVKPDHLTDEESAAVPLAALTAWRALVRQGKVDTEKHVLITGIGGGVSVWALKFCVAMGVQTWVSSRHEAKIAKAKSLGAQDGYVTSDPSWVKSVSTDKYFDVVIDSVGGDKLNEYLRVLNLGGRIVIYGSSSGMPGSLDVFRLFWLQASIQGSTMGNDEEFMGMIDFIAKNQIKPEIDSVRTFDKAVEAFDDMKSGRQMGKLVLKFS